MFELTSIFPQSVVMFFSLKEIGNPCDNWAHIITNYPINICTNFFMAESPSQLIPPAISRISKYEQYAPQTGIDN